MALFFAGLATLLFLLAWPVPRLASRLSAASVLLGPTRFPSLLERPG
jgi:hypothetical protein